MLRFALGVVATLLVHLIGWPRIESAVRTANTAAQTAYHAAETHVRALEVSQ